MIQKIGRVAPKPEIERLRRLAYESLEARHLLAATTPSFDPIGNLNVPFTAPLHVGINGDHGLGENITYTVETNNPNLQAEILTGNRSWALSVQDQGTMIFEFFEGRAPRATGQIIELIESDFYDNKEFIRIVDNFVIQATGQQSPLEDFDDEFHVDLNHGQVGTLSMAKAGEDDNNAEFFVTLVTTRFLDFHHSVFGVITEGVDVLQSIGDLPTEPNPSTGENSSPVDPVVITNSEVFTDNENAVLFLKALTDPDGNDGGLGLGPEDSVGPIEVTVTATDESGNTFSETFEVSITDDTDPNANSLPFLDEIDPVLGAVPGATIDFTITAYDAEGDEITLFFDPAGLSVPFQTTTITPVGQKGETTFEITFDSDFVGRGGLRIFAFDNSRPPSGPDDFSNLDLNTFIIEINPDAPTSVDLLPGSDTGPSDSDNDTDAPLLTFRVDGLNVIGNTEGTVELLNGDTVIGTAVVQAGTTEVDITVDTLTNFANGVNAVTARLVVEGLDVENPAGSVTMTSAPTPVLNVTVDTTDLGISPPLPTTALVGVPYVYDAGHAREDDVDSIYEIVNGPDGMTIDEDTGVITWTPAGNQVGPNEVTIRFTHSGGVEDELSATVDVSVPVPGTPDLTFESDTGFSDTDDLTNDSTPTFEVADVVPNSLVKIYANGVEVGSATAPDGTPGTFVTVTVETTIPAGQLNDDSNVTATMTVDGVESAASGTLAVSFDTTIGPITTNIPAQISVGFIGLFNASNDEEGDPQFRYSLVSPPEGVSINATQGVITWQPTVAQVGNQTITVKGVDAAGNETTLETVIEILADPPTGVVLASSSDTGVTGDDKTNQALPTFLVSGVVPNATVVVKVGDTVVGTAVAPDGEAGVLQDVEVPTDASFPFTNGNHTVTATQTLITESDASTSFTFEVDLVPPADNTGTAAATGAVDVLYTFDPGNAEEGNTGFGYALGPAPDGMTIDPSTGAVAWTPTVDQIGDQSFTIVAIDAAGNESSNVYHVEIAPPPPTAIDLLDDTGFSDSDDLTNDTTPRFEVFGLVGAEIEVFANGQSIGTGTVGPGGSAIVETTIPAGLQNQQVSITATQTVNPTSTASAALEVTFDTTAPAVFTVPLPTEAVAGIPYEYDPNNPEEGTTGFTYELGAPLDDATIDPDTGVISWIPNVAQVGQQTVTVIARDAAGNETSLSETVEVELPSGPPNTVGIEASTDSGASDSDGVTNDPTPTLFATAVAPGALVKFFDNGVLIAQGTVPANTTTIFVELVDPLDEGEHVITATQTINVESEPSSSFTVVVDLTPPEENTGEAPTSGTVGVSYSFDPGNAEEGDAGFSYSLGPAPAGMTIDPNTGEVSWTPGVDQTGDQSFTINAIDLAGNSTATSYDVVIEPPAPTAVDLLDDTGISDTDDLTNDATPRFEVFGVVPGGTVTLFANGAEIGTAVAPGDGPADQLVSVIVDTTIPENLQNQAIDITAEVTINPTGAVSAPLTITVDTIAPAEITGEAADTVVAGETYTFDPGNAEEGQSGFRYSLGDAPDGMTIDELTGEVSWTPTVDQVGDPSYTIIATDAAGNETSSDYDVEVAPPAPLAIDLLSEFDTGSVDTDNVTRLTTLSFLITGVSEGATVTLLAGGTAVGSAVVESGQTSVVVAVDSPELLSEGENVFTATQTINPESAESPALVVTIDTTIAEITPPLPTEAIFNQVFRYDVDHAEEGNPGFRYELVDPPDGMTIDPLTGEIEWDAQFPIFLVDENAVDQLLLEGSLSFGVKAIDLAGNETTISTELDLVFPPPIELPDGPTIDLLSEFDSGVSDSDNITNIKSFQILVTDLIRTIGLSSRVTLFVGSTELGFVEVPGATFSSPGEFFTSAIVTVTNPDALAEGVNSITAVQTIPDIVDSQGNPIAFGFTFGPSDPLEITIDMIAPAGETPPVPETASVGFPVDYDAENVEEGTPGFSYALQNPPAGASIDPVTGVLSWTPTVDQVGEQTITILATDAAGNQDTLISAVVEVIASAVDDQYTTPEDNLLLGISQPDSLGILDQPFPTPVDGVIIEGSVLENDGVVGNVADVEAQLVSNVSNGVLNFLSDGSFSYRPNANFSGVDSYTYQFVRNGVASNVATVTILVTEVNDLPIAVDDVFVVDQTSVANQLPATANDSIGPDVNEALTIIAVDPPSAGGTATIAPGGTSIAYTPAASFAGLETIRYTVDDGRGGQARGQVTVVVDPIIFRDLTGGETGTANIFVVDTSSEGIGTGAATTGIGVRATFVPPADNRSGTDPSFLDGGGNGVAEANRAVYQTVYRIFMDVPEALSETVERLNGNGGPAITEGEAAQALQLLEQSLTEPDGNSPLTAFLKSEAAALSLENQDTINALLDAGANSLPVMPAEFWEALEDALQNILETT
ncbi:MAG: peptidylprolyl isomerase, partial [Planctomycetota bacterium]